MIKLHPSNVVSYGLSGLVILLVMGISIWQGQYGTDPHHWGLMLGNAVDLQNGLLPYSEVFIQYGILTTLIQMLGLKLLGANLLSLIAVTAFFYALGLIAIQKIVEVLTGSMILMPPIRSEEFSLLAIQRAVELVAPCCGRVKTDAPLVRGSMKASA